MNLCMHPVRRPHRLVTLVLVLLAAGCRSGVGELASPDDGIACGLLPEAPRVFIEIRYDSQGTPSATPETCEIRSGTVVTWRGPAGDVAPFEIAFKDASPVATEPRGTFHSKPDGDRQKVARRLDGASGRYAYGVRANGRELDPAIIIR